ncbi:MAG TPA: ECF-type sigma factor [Steroidobacteraceae bacterium]|nr:ECF-type sigma factor [Steroidobacteraceae bacterium]
MNDAIPLLQPNKNSARAGELFAQLYDELRARAHDQVRRGGSSMNTTTLVHESFLRLSQSGRLQIEDQRHFLAYACTVMRSVVVDFARANLSDKRGHGVAPVTLNTDIVNATVASDTDVLKIHDALDELATLDQRLAKVVEMRYFGGLTDAEIADALQLTTRTVQRDWEKARLLLRSMLKADS